MVSNAQKLLDSINSPDDIKRLSPEQADILADEIRSLLVSTVTKTGGHLASNLGVVELTLALHRVFNCPDDKIVWDVGHQSYVHKLITGRRNRFDTLRCPGGLSGFTCRSESVYDPFGAGHSSTSVSAALGIAEAERLMGTRNWTVAVVGDGAFTGGMIHEALNNCGDKKNLRLIIIINENEMSISKNIGRFAMAISKIRNTPKYFRTKSRTRAFLSKLPIIGKWLIHLTVRFKKFIKNALYGSNYFEDLGLFYMGPIDGNDREKVEELLAEAKRTDGSTVIHIKTVKGKGYPPAEMTPDTYHSLRPEGKMCKDDSFSVQFGNYICELAEKDDRICGITAAMSSGTGLSSFESRFPERFFDVGIAEEHAATFCAGLAADGMKPVFAVYSSFLQRSYDNLLHDISLQKLPVVLCIDRAGLSESDGATHHGIFDVSFLSGIPNFKIYTPATYECLKRALKDSLSFSGPSAIRYPNGSQEALIASSFYPLGDDGVIRQRSYNIHEGTDCVIICHGRIATVAIGAADKLSQEGYETGVVLCEFIRPYDDAVKGALELIHSSCKKIVFLEEEIRSGGFGMNMQDSLNRLFPWHGLTTAIIASDECFPVPSVNQSVFEAAGVDCDSVIEKIKNIMRD